MAAPSELHVIGPALAALKDGAARARQAIIYYIPLTSWKRRHENQWDHIPSNGRGSDFHAVCGGLRARKFGTGSDADRRWFFSSRKKPCLRQGGRILRRLPDPAAAVVGRSAAGDHRQAG